MKSLPLNLSSMQKVAGDKHCSTFLHKDGHHITIAHSALPALQRNQLIKLPIKPMAEGGEVKGVHQPATSHKDAQSMGESKAGHHASIGGEKHNDAAYHEHKRVLSENRQIQPKLQGLAEGGEVGVHTSDMEISHPKDKKEKPWAGESTAGRHLRESDIHPTAHKKVLGQHYRVLDELKAMPNPKIQGLADGSDDVQPQTVTPSQGSPSPSPQLDPDKVKSFLQGFTGSTHDYAEGTPDAGDDTQVQPNSNASVFANQQVNAKAPPAQQAPNQLNPNSTVNAPAAFNLQQRAAGEQAAVDQAKGAQQAQIEKGYVDAQAQQAQQDQQHIQDMKQHTDSFAADMQKGLINPNHYVENMGAANKVGTAIGLFLGGFGGANNPALNFLNQQIDRDINAQKTRADQQKTIFGAYQNLYGDQNVASDLAKVSMNHVYDAKVRQTAAQLATPQAKALSDAFSAQKALENNQLLLQASQNPAIQTAYPTQGRQSPGAQSPAQNPNVQSTLDQNGNPVDSGNQPPGGSPQPAVEGFQPTHILTPDATTKINQGDLAKLPGWGDAGDARTQATQAQQLEKVLNGVKGDGVGSVKDYFNQLYDNSGNGALIRGAGGALQRGGSQVTNAIAHIFGAPGGMDLPAYSDATKSYEANHQNLKTALASALHGQISVNDLDNMLSKYTPGYGDSKELVDKKYNDFVNELKRSLNTTALDTHNLTIDSHQKKR